MSKRLSDVQVIYKPGYSIKSYGLNSSEIGEGKRGRGLESVIETRNL